MPVTLPRLELETLAGAARGETVAETASRMGVPVGTVKQLRRAVLDKLGDAANMTAAVHRAHEVGLLGQRPDPDRLPLTGTQRDALHAKCSELDVARKLERRTTKKQTLVEASRMFGREITSANDLTRGEARVVLDHLEQQLDSAAAASDETTATPAATEAIA